jgi:hypothetical protein
MMAKWLEEDNGMSSCAPEVHHVYPLKEMRLGGQHQQAAEGVSGATWSLQGQLAALKELLEHSLHPKGDH